MPNDGGGGGGGGVINDSFEALILFALMMNIKDY